MGSARKCCGGVILLIFIFSVGHPRTCEPHGTKEVRRAALDKLLASIGCDDYACRKFSIIILGHTVCMCNKNTYVATAEYT